LDLFQNRRKTPLGMGPPEEGYVMENGASITGTYLRRNF
jgi:hypothetical protein